jgi:hypothetical protein
MGAPRGPKQLRECSSSPTMAARPAAVPHPPWMTLNAVITMNTRPEPARDHDYPASSSMPITGTPATAGSRIQITQFGMTASGHFNNLAVARIGGSGRDRFDGLGVTHGSLAGRGSTRPSGFQDCRH